MTIDFSKFSLNDLYINLMPRHTDENGLDLPAPILAQKHTTLDLHDKLFLEKEIRKSIGSSQAKGLEPDISSAKSNSNPLRIANIILSKTDILSVNKHMMEDLREAQGMRKGGKYLVGFCTGSVSGQPTFIVFVMPLQTGLRALFSDGAAPTLRQVKDLIVAKNGQFERIFGFWLNGSPLPGGLSFDPSASDRQFTKYFVTDFLGYGAQALAHDNTKKTRDRLNFIANKCLPNSEARLELRKDVIELLESPDPNINISAFIEEKIPKEYKEIAKQEMNKVRVPNVFEKDISDLSKSSGNISVKFENGAKISFPKELLGDSVVTKIDDDGKSWIMIKGAWTFVNG